MTSMLLYRRRDTRPSRLRADHRHRRRRLPGSIELGGSGHLGSNLPSAIRSSVRRVTDSGRSSQSGPAGWGKQRESVGSQKWPSGQSKLSVQLSPGVAHSEARQTSPAAQQTEPSAPHRMPDAQGGTQAPSKHSSPTSQQTAGVPQSRGRITGLGAAASTTASGPRSTGSATLPACAANARGSAGAAANSHVSVSGARYNPPRRSRRRNKPSLRAVMVQYYSTMERGAWADCELDYATISLIRPRSRLACPKSSTGSAFSFRSPTAVARVFRSLLWGWSPAST